MEDRRGLTWVELLVVVVVIGLLVALLMPSLNGTHVPAKKTQCAANLKGMGATLNIYAAQWKDGLPQVGEGAGVTWLCDQTVGFRDLLAGGGGAAGVGGAGMKGFYCPSNAGEMTAERWTHGAVSVWGYAMFNERGDKAGLAALPERATTPLTYWKKLTDMEHPADQELALDNIVSNGAGGAGTIFAGVKGGALPEIEYSTNHVDKNRTLGANILCGDGHVAWRKFPTDATNPANAVTIKQSGEREAYFWVPNP